jgi:hypothetical protein
MRQAAQDVGEVVVGIDAAASAADQKRVEDGASPAGIGMSNEEPALAANGGGTDAVFDEVIVDFEEAVLEIAGQSVVLVEEVVESLAHGALRQERGLEFGSLGLHPIPYFRSLLPALVEAFGGSKPSKLVFNSVKRADLGNKPDGVGEAFLDRSERGRDPARRTTEPPYAKGNLTFERILKYR